MSRSGSILIALLLCLPPAPAFAGDMDYIDEIIESTGRSGGDTHRVSPSSRFRAEIEETERDFRRRLKADRAGWRRLFTGEKCVTIQKLEKQCADTYSGDQYRDCMRRVRYIDRHAEKDYSCIDWKSVERLMR